MNDLFYVLVLRGIDFYEKAAEENKLADLETIRGIVNRLGENGYPAVDSRNQVNMTEAEQVLEFCEKVDAQEEAEITILEVSYLGGFVKYDLHTKDGNVDVVRSYYKYENGNMKREVTGNYQAEYWNYTEEGYLMFSGVWFSEELYVLTLSGAEEHTALRVQPLDETYREESYLKKKKDEITIRSSAAEYLTYVASIGDQQDSIEMRYEDENIWLTQKMMATLYDVETNTINYHIKKVFNDSELQEDSVIRKFRITAADGKSYNTNHYSLEMIIAVGFKVNSEQNAFCNSWLYSG